MNKDHYRVKIKLINNSGIKIPSNLLNPLNAKAGRSAGKISMRRKCGGTKKQYRIVDFKRNKPNITGKIARIDYDPNRSANIALIKYVDGEWSYIIAASDMKIGQSIIAGEQVPIKTGNRMPLKNIPIGTEVYNIELTPGKGGQVVRSAGSSAIIQSMDDKYMHIKLPSSEIRRIFGGCFASIGKVSNIEHNTSKGHKAGLLKYMGKRPRVRGKAMAPNAHPHGGGEGVNPIGLVHPKTPWGKPTIGYKTRKKKISDIMIVKRRKK